MDSPFLPRKGNPHQFEDDGSLVLADLSIVSDGEPDSPLRPPARGVSFAPSAASSAAPTPVVPQRSAARPRFSLFAPGASASTTPSSSSVLARSGGDGADADVGEESELHDHDDDDDHPEASSSAPTAPAAPLSASAAAARDDRLRASLAELRGMNSVFDGFLTSLENSKAHNERLATRVKETRALLDTYVGLVGQTHHTQKLLLNPKWTGATGDAAALLEAERARLEEEERAAEAARLAEEERARAAAAKAEAEEAARRAAEAKPTRGRGIGRGTGIARGRGGVARGAATSSGIPSRTVRPTSAAGGAAGTRRPASGGSGTASTVSTTAGGTMGRYGHVQSSGYGPRPRGS